MNKSPIVPVNLSDEITLKRFLQALVDSINTSRVTTPDKGHTDSSTDKDAVNTIIQQYDDSSISSSLKNLAKEIKKIEDSIDSGKGDLEEVQNKIYKVLEDNLAGKLSKSEFNEFASKLTDKFMDKKEFLRFTDLVYETYLPAVHKVWNVKKSAIVYTVGPPVKNWWGVETAPSTGSSSIVFQITAEGQYDQERIFSAAILTGDGMKEKTGGAFSTLNGVLIFEDGARVYTDKYNEHNGRSDARFKENIKDANEFDALSVIDKMQFKSYNWKEDIPWEKDRGRKVSIGQLAQEVEEIMPELVREQVDTIGPTPTYKYLEVMEMLNIALKGIQQLQERVKELEAKVLA